MPITSTVTPLNIHIGRGDLYVGVTVPATPPVALTGGTPTDGVGTFIGGTLEGANLVYRPTTVDVHTQQSTVLAATTVNTEEMRLEFTIGEITFANLKQFLLGATGASALISLGGQFIPATTAILLIAPKRDGNFIEVMIYNAYFPEDRTVHFAREAHTMVKVVARGIGVFTRAQGDRLGFFHPAVVSA